MSDHLDSIHRARCQCDRTGPETSDLHEVWRLAIAEGWYVDSRVCLCPDCYLFARERQARVDSEWTEAVEAATPGWEAEAENRRLHEEACRPRIIAADVTPEIVNEIRAESRETAKAVNKVRRAMQRTGLSWPDIAAFVGSVQPMEEE